MGRVAASIIMFLIAFVTGSWLFGGGGSAGATATTTPAATTTTPPQAVFVSPAETVLGPAIVIAGEPDLAGSELAIQFDLIGLAPTGDAASVQRHLGFGNTMDVLPQDLETLWLNDWSLEAGNDRISGTTANPAARAARFEVGGEFDASQIDRVVIDSYAVLAPLRADIRLGIGTESAVVAPGLTARLLAITEQAKSIVQIEMVSDREFNLDNIRISGVGPGWLSAVPEAEGRPRWNLTHESPVAPDPIMIRVEGASWITVDQSIPVVLGSGQ
jgi:hypothetical protein